MVRETRCKNPVDATAGTGCARDRAWSLTGPKAVVRQYQRPETVRRADAADRVKIGDPVSASVTFPPTGRTCDVFPMMSVTITVPAAVNST